MTNVKCLATGSTGNCYILTIDGSQFILDAGCNWQKLMREVNLNDIEFAYISHTHKDHSRNYDKLLKNKVKCLDGININGLEENQIKAKNGALYLISRFDIKHGDCNNAALVIQSDSECVLNATDFNLCEYDLTMFKFTHILVECNYVEEMVNQCSDRVRRENNIDRHMGLEGTKIFLDSLDLSQCREIDLIHISQNFGNPILMWSDIYSRYHIDVGVCKQYGGIDYYGR